MIPFDTKNTLPAVMNFVHQIKEHIYTKVADLQLGFFNTKEPVAFEDVKNYQFKSIDVGQKWGNLWDCAWFDIKATLPANYNKSNLALVLDFQGEACIYAPNGDTLRALTCVNSEFDTSLGLPGKTILPLDEITIVNNNIHLLADVGCNDLFGKYRGGLLQKAELALCNNQLRDFYYDYLVLALLCKSLPESSSQHYSILYALEKAMNCISSAFTADEAISGRAFLQPELNRTNCADYPLEFVGIGHAHLDLAWLWPIRETKRKAVRTLSTAIANLNQYPQYLFGVSQPQQLAWIKETNPLLFAKIKEKVKEKRIELQGAMWVEPDTNCPSGESLTRQILYGTKFYKDEFDVTVNNVWLPDAFGFNGNLPQIIKKSGIDNFLTIKLSWNEHNYFPHHTFVWSGIDNSQVIVHLPPEGTYNSNCSPESLAIGESNYIEKGLIDSAVVLFGIGDGGAGPGRDHIERAKRLSKNILGLPKFKLGFVSKFFNNIKTQKDKLPVFNGELYLEKHQGTLTTQAKNKFFNRKIEWLLHNAEYLCVCAYLKGDKYPTLQLETIWKEVLLYQFHDILPGSSINRVYRESVERYVELCKQLNDIIASKLQFLTTDNAQSLINLTSFDNDFIVKNNNKWQRAYVKPYSCALLEDYTTISSSLVDDNILENNLIKVIFDDNGGITSIFDKTLNKECLLGKGNVLNVYNDFGDAWDMYINYNKSLNGHFELIDCKNTKDGPVVEKRQVFKFNKSTLTQRVFITDNSNLVTFENHLDWQEDSKLFRVEFEVSPVSGSATCDIQFGNIKRNTTINNSLDYAQFEVCAQKYIDLSQDDFGVALLNDCKYGHRAKGRHLSIDLARAPHYPDQSADIGEHDFNYAFLPHATNNLNEVIKQAYLFNNHALQYKNVSLPQLVSFEDSVVLETIKLAESADGIIVRLSEQLGKHQDTSIAINKLFAKVEVVNLIEEFVSNAKIIDGKCNISFSPFEVITLKLLCKLEDK